MNLFAIVSKSPQILRTSSDPIGLLNNYELKRKLAIWSGDPNWDLWLGWGNKGVLKQRNEEFLAFLEPFSMIRAKDFKDSKGALTIGWTNSGQPLHPLYIPQSKYLIPFHKKKSKVL